MYVLSSGSRAWTSMPSRYHSSSVLTANAWRLYGIPHNRHSFAIRTLLDWYRGGVDVQAQLPLLSTYLGHVNPATIYHYLSAAPELLALAGERLERHLAEDFS
jgi:hypothetical protein